jgi:transcriptional regulator with XRE-family HTH domain
VAAQDTLTLNSAWLRNRVAELRLKQWWLAEQAGVDKKTVVRWLHGHVRSIRIDNARVLAGILGCRVDELALPDDRAELATESDQARAAELLASGALIDRLGPVGDWDVIETLIKAIAVPQLPAHVLATLYNQLCVACWRQSKLEPAQTYNDAALALAERCGDKALLAAALHSRANLQHWRGECAAAQATYGRCLALAPYLDMPALANTHSNFGASLYETGAFDAGREQLVQALALLRLRGTPMQLAIARTHLAILALRTDALPAAREHARWAREHAEQAGYRRGVAMAALLDADLAARDGAVPQALAQLADGRRRFAELRIDEGLNEEFAARVLRLAGRFDDAQAAVTRGLACSDGFPLERAQLHLEQARLCAARAAADDAHGVRAALAAARALFERCGAARWSEACHRMSLDAAGAAP